MKRTFLFVFTFVVIFWSESDGEDDKPLQSKSWKYVSLNRSSPVLFQNISAVVENEKLNGRGKLYGAWFFDESSSKLFKKNHYEENKTTNTRSRSNIISASLQSILPPFAITSENVLNDQCKRDSRKFLKHLDEMDLWAFKMFDSCGKLPSGLLNGNINQFGDFDQCLSIDEPQVQIRGKYCLAYLQIRPNGNDFESGDVSRAFSLMHSHFVFRSKLTDPGHRVPRFSTINWGLCLPNSCSSEDVESQLKTIAQRFSKGTGFEVEVKVDEEMCQEKKQFRISVSFLIVSCIFLLIVGMSGLATLREVFWAQENHGLVDFWSILNCFSLKRNGKALFSLSRSSDDIECVHGIRMLNAFMLVLSHKSMALFFMPYSNRTSMVEKLSQPWTIIARTASLYTDSFIMISGLLTSYSFVKTLKKTGNLDLKNEYFGRLIRIVPSLAAIILLSTFILPELGSGPQWNLTVSHHAEKCKKTWWKNFLFIHNYLGFENMCLTHTHHVGIDTQLFFASPFLVISLFKWPGYGLTSLAALAAVSTGARYQATFEKNLSFFIYPGISVGQMFDTANHSYIIPFHRLTVYIIGIVLGYALRFYGKEHKIKSNILRIGWTISISFLWYALTKANEMNDPSHTYDSEEAATYAALAPVAWCLFFAWLTFVSQIGRGGIVGDFLSCRYWLIWTRLSYAVYLTQFPIFFFNVGLQKHPQQYSFFLLVNILEYICIFVASICLTLFVDMPFVNLKKLLIQK